MLGPTREAVKIGDDHWRILVKPPPWTNIKESGVVNLSRNQYGRYLAWLGTDFLVQDMFPDLSPEERDILLSGVPGGLKNLGSDA